jgi:hypothetical protein
MVRPTFHAMYYRSGMADIHQSTREQYAELTLLFITGRDYHHAGINELQVTAE